MVQLLRPAMALLLSLILAIDCPAQAQELKLPNLGESSTSMFSAEFEYNLGRAWLRIFRSQVPTVDDPLLHDYLEQGGHFTVDDLLRDPWERSRMLRAIVLLVRRRNDRILLPDSDAPLKSGDRLLICGNRGAFTRMHWTVSHRHTLDYIKTGDDQPQSWIWRRLLTRDHYPKR